MNLNTEQDIFNQGHKLVGALDEAGRGPLAGPVVAACVLVSPDMKISEDLLVAVKDSKKLTEKKRGELFEIINKDFRVGIGVCDHETIDRINILEATFLAMKKALGALREKPEFIILDGKFPIPNLSIKQKAIIKGDDSVFSIAAASIVAKVTRDKMILEAHEKYPQYGFDKHKGYGTKAHMEALKQYGPCGIHRKSFEPVRVLLNR